MGRYSNVLHDLWADTAVRELSADAKLLFVWSFTNGPCASLTGFTVVSPRKLRRVLQETPLATEKRLESALDELAAKPLVVYDWDVELLWALNRAKHANTSPKVAVAIRNWIEGMARDHPSPLIGQWRRRYGDLIR